MVRLVPPPLLAGQALARAGGAQGFGPGGGVHGLGQVGQDLGGLRAVAVQGSERLQRLRRGTGEQLLEQVEDAAAARRHSRGTA